MKNPLKTADLLRNTARYTLLAVTILVLVFALLSGAGEYGGGISGIIKNSPNALPWLILLAVAVLAWKRELAGGILITGLGIAMLFFFNVFSRNFHIAVLLLILAIIILGICFILSWMLRRTQ